ncbi:substrate-binding domain-containing protein [Amphibacillus sp. Q70]|uniref:substrate-binding domain-containing protein n=1 Tax=Amphibacillus sp. Q70 TaxID=3453416 RepID=UPI003F86F6D4
MYAKSKGIKVPEQLKIIGYDYHSFTQMLQEPKLTSIKQPIEQLGKSLARTLIKQIQHKDTGDQVERTLYDVELIKGHTT